MINATPSLFKPYDEFWSGDPAFEQAPSEDAPKEAHDAYGTKVRVARETGNWDGLLIPGQKPTRFKMRPLTPELVMTLRDMEIGHSQGELHNLMMLIWVRAALVGVVGLEDSKTGKDYVVQRAIDGRFPLLGKIATPEVTDAIWHLAVDTEDGGREQIGMRIIGELYGLQMHRASGGLLPKS